MSGEHAVLPDRRKEHGFAASCQPLVGIDRNDFDYQAGKLSIQPILSFGEIGLIWHSSGITLILS